MQDAWLLVDPWWQPEDDNMLSNTYTQKCTCWAEYSVSSRLTSKCYKYTENVERLPWHSLLLYSFINTAEAIDTSQTSSFRSSTASALFGGMCAYTMI